MNQLPRGFVHNGESSRVKDEEHKGGFACVGEGKSCKCASMHVRRCCTRECYPSSSPQFSLYLWVFIVSARMHRYRHIRFRFFSALLSRSCALFFYFPTIIILSNFAHSKRCRKFVQVTPRETRRIPCREKPRFFIRCEVNALLCKCRRNGFECVSIY